MNPWLATASLIFVSTILLVLPLVPAMSEFRLQSDASPLSVIQQHAGDIRFFADGFRQYISVVEPTRQQCLASGFSATVVMPDGEQCLVLGKCEGEFAPPLHEGTDMCSTVIVAGSDLHLGSGINFSKDIYAKGNFVGGENNRYRAILGDQDIHLRSSSTVMRWVHAVGRVVADEDCTLYGRISSAAGARLSAGCSFLRVNAPRIEIGDSANLKDPSSSRPASQITQRLLHDGDFEIAPGETFHGNLVVRGGLRIGAGAGVCGSVKCDREMVIDDGATVLGSVISRNLVRIGSRCMIHGPVISERAVMVQSGTRLGSEEIPTTVSAPQIEIEEGVLVFGTLWARELGQVVTRV